MLQTIFEAIIFKTPLFPPSTLNGGLQLEQRLSHDLSVPGRNSWQSPRMSDMWWAARNCSRKFASAAAISIAKFFTVICRVVFHHFMGHWHSTRCLQTRCVQSSAGATIRQLRTIWTETRPWQTTSNFAPLHILQVLGSVYKIKVQTSQYRVPCACELISRSLAFNNSYTHPNVWLGGCHCLHLCLQLQIPPLANQLDTSWKPSAQPSSASYGPYANQRQAQRIKPGIEASFRHLGQWRTRPQLVLVEVLNASRSHSAEYWAKCKIVSSLRQATNDLLPVGVEAQFPSQGKVYFAYDLLILQPIHH